MRYLVEMRLVDAGRSTNPQEGLFFLENYVLPTLERCQELEREGRIIAGGPISATIGIAMIIEAATPLEIDQIVSDLPLWPRTNTVVTPLTTFGDRALGLRPRLERIKAKLGQGAA